MNVDYGKNRDRDGGPFTTFESSLFVRVAVMVARPMIVRDRRCRAEGARLRSGRAARLRRARRKPTSDEHGRHAPVLCLDQYGRQLLRHYRGTRNAV